MKKVVIEIRRGKPVVISCPKKVEVVFKTPKRKSARKILRTWFYHMKKPFLQ